MTADGAANAGGIYQASQQSDDADLVLATSITPQMRAQQMEILTITALRNKMANRWEAQKSSIHSKIENILATELGLWDFSTLVGDDSFLIVYGKNDCEAAKNTSRSIGEKLEAAFGGKMHSSLFDLRPENRKLLKIVLAETVDKSPVWVEGERSEKFDGEAASIEPAIKNAGAAERRRRTQYQIGYAPLWNIRQEVLVGFCVLPLVSRADGVQVFGHDVLRATAETSEFLTLDAHMLRSQIEMTAELLQNNFTSLLTSQIHFNTLSSTASREEIFKIVRQIPSFMKNVLMLAIVGIPENTPAATVALRVAGLKNFFRALTIRVPHMSFPLAECTSWGAVAACYRVRPGQKKEALLLEARRFISNAQSARLLTTFEEVPDIETAIALKEIGATFVTGFFLGEIVDVPSNMRRLSIADLRARPNANL